MSLAPFYLIVDDVQWLRRLLPLGVRLVQLRIKDRPVQALSQSIREARDLCHEYGCQLIVNDYWQLALELDCDYVHLGQEDLDSADVKAIKAAGIRLGISTHDSSELQRALTHNPDYIALGPVYETILKKMKWAPQGLDKLSVWKERIGDIPLVAIGGLTPERGKLALAAGADSVCVVTDVLRNADPEARVAQWLTATDETADQTL